MSSPSVPKVQTEDRNVNQLQSNMIPKINMLLGLPLNNGTLLTSVSLKTGSNTINTGLNRTLVGWIVTRFRGAWAQVYDTQSTNSTPNSTLLLNASAPVTVDLWVF